MQLPESAIRDTVAAVFSDPAYHRSSVLQRVVAWVVDWIEMLLLRLGPGGVPSPVFWAVVALLGAVVLAVLARAVWATGRLGRVERERGEAGIGGAGDADPWAVARAFAARGDYTAAAHALYAAILAAAHGRGEIELHESKTIGDYLRELRARSSGLVSGFREFARSYETVVYGGVRCDRGRYERLHGLADRLVGRGA